MITTSEYRSGVLQLIILSFDTNKTIQLKVKEMGDRNPITSDFRNHKLFTKISY